MNLSRVSEGDIVLLDKKGRRFHALVTARDKQQLVVQPLDKRVTYRTATAREVVDAWFRARKRATKTKE